MGVIPECSWLHVGSTSGKRNEVAQNVGKVKHIKAEGQPF
jgi:hypothetical protein